MEADAYHDLMADTPLVIVGAFGFDPKPLLRRFADRFEEQGQNTWAASFPTDLHGLAVIEHSDPSEILSVSAGPRRVDADGWADWSISSPGEHERTDALLSPAAGP